MHYHLFPTEDTYITNKTGYEEKNFGLNEILRIGTDESSVKSLESTRSYSYSNAVWTNYCATDFTGIFTGSFVGEATIANGVIVCSSSFSSSYFSGSLDSADITEISGAISGSVSGSITGSLISYYLPNFSGQLTGSSGVFNGTVTGIDSRSENYWRTTSTKFSDRSLIKFDVGYISESISNGKITSPTCKLNLKVCNEYELPITYKIYAFPISQSWIMGNGYFSDDGSDEGANWYYTDKSSGSLWYAPVTTSIRPVVDFLNTSSNSTGSFSYGGGTWYYTDGISSLTSTQSFNYESSDICMDVTNIVMSWISESIPNNGFILISSDEIVSTGSGFSLTFYGKDTNSINSPYLDIMWSDWVWTSGSVGTSSVVITSSNAGMSLTTQTGSTFTIDGGISGSFSSSVYFTTSSTLDEYKNYFEAIILGTGLSGNIAGLPIIGPVSGSIDISSSVLSGACGQSSTGYPVTASFTDGMWISSSFMGWYINGKIINAWLTGSWYI